MMAINAKAPGRAPAGADNRIAKPATAPLRLAVMASAIPASLCLAFALATPAAAQNSDGRDGGGSTSSPTSTSRPRKPVRRPKKVIPAQPTHDAKIPTASVIIRSHPEGADVFVDGKNVGTTADDGELELSELRLGPHLIVLRKEGFREWSQTVTLKTVDPVEVNPLLQDVNAPMPRNLSKIPPIELGKSAAGELSRDDPSAPDGSGYYDEFVFRTQGPDAFIVKLKANGFTPTVAILDDDNHKYDVRSIGQNVYQSVSVPHAGTYYLRVSAAIDESSFVGGDYSVTMQSETVQRAAQEITIGGTVEGDLDVTDRMSGANDYYDAWTFQGVAGTRVTISATSDEFTPALTLLLNNSAVASSGKADAKKKKGSSAPPNAIDQSLESGVYTIYVRSAAGAKQGHYRLTVSTAATK